LVRLDLLLGISGGQVVERKLPLKIFVYGLGKISVVLRMKVVLE
jgi:hypothetical protein